MTRRRRSSLAASAVFLIATSAHAAGAQVAAMPDPPRVLGVESAPPNVGLPLAPDRAPGTSGAIQLVMVLPESSLDLGELRALGEGWELGHRWVPLDEPESSDGPPILGQPAAPNPAVHGSDLPFEIGAIVSPARPGLWRLESATGSAVTVATKVPASNKRNGRLNGYYIGTYPTEGAGRLDIYAPPEAYIEVTAANRETPVSEHLRLGQFLTKDQFSVWPKYVALDPRLIDKLELVLQELNAMGIRASAMHVMSGFRTPQYNGPGGGGRAALSRHMWGDAADVWIDSWGTGNMDDLNGDGRIDIDDAAVVMRAVERVEAKYPHLVGGAGTYPTTDTHPPYIHIDARGTRARW